MSYVRFALKEIAVLKIINFVANLVAIVFVLCLPGCAGFAAVIGSVAKSEYTEFAIQVKNEIEIAKHQAILEAVGAARDSSMQDAAIAGFGAVGLRYASKFAESKIGKKKPTT